MIIANGTIQAIETTGGGYQNGNPVAASQRMGEPIACNLQVASSDKRGTYVGGKFTRTQLVVLIDEQPFTAQRVKVTDTLRGVELGTFTVQAVRQLHAAGATQIDL